MRNRLFLVLFWLSVQAATAQTLRQLPNPTFTQWNGPEPANWKTNNVYDDQGKLVRTLVEPVGTAGARLTVKRVVHRAEWPAIIAFTGGSLSSALAPFMPQAEKPVRLLVHYRFVPDSADVLIAAISLESRNNETGTLKPDKSCDCQLKTPFGDGPITLPKAETSQAIAFEAIFPGSANPTTVPSGCTMYVWKIRFWIENKAAHPHERTEAIIEQVDIQP